MGGGDNGRLLAHCAVERCRDGNFKEAVERHRTKLLVLGKTASEEENMGFYIGVRGAGEKTDEQRGGCQRSPHNRLWTVTSTKDSPGR